jgi:hypothetical protein
VTEEIVAEVRPYFDNDRLFDALTEQLKLPLLQISQHIELARMGRPTRASHIETVANMALNLIESYQMSRQLLSEQLALIIEPVSVAAVLQSTVEKLQPFAREYSCELRLDVSGKYRPVMANRQSLEAAIASLGYSLIEMQAASNVRRPQIVLGAHKSRSGIVVGAFGEQEKLTADMFRRSKLFYGNTKQSLPTIGHTSSAGIFVADSLFQAMTSKLVVAQHSKLTGLAATLLPSPQLQLV